MQERNSGRVWIQMHPEGGGRVEQLVWWQERQGGTEGSDFTVPEKRRGVVGQAGDVRWWAARLESWASVGC